ncbi:4-phosphopantetheinyl transferase [Lysobacteraceae bacterium NML07-0707]|nr:4-phosphopantetheinyl transferase [Xanthomonadaceae bacterium NML07-0707]
MRQLPLYTLLPYPPGAHAQTLARDWLAQQLQYPADQLPLYRDARGRPRLAEPLADIDINWSHSVEKLLVVHGKNIQLGCDLEYIRPRPNALKLARRFFHPQEADWLANLSPSEQEAAFLHLWCAKEAILKAHGHGLSFGLEKLCLSPGSNGLYLKACHPDLGKAGDWQLSGFSPAPGYWAALAWREID